MWAPGYQVRQGVGLVRFQKKGLGNKVAWGLGLLRNTDSADRVVVGGGGGGEGYGLIFLRS